MNSPRTELRVGRVLAMAAALGAGLGLALSMFDVHRDDERRRQLSQAHLSGVPAAVPPMTRQRPTAPQPDPAALAGLPAYPHASALPLLSQPEGVDGELKAAWFATDDSPAAVISFYEKALKAEGQAVVSHRFGEGSGYAGYLDADGQTMHLVAVLRQGGQTIAFPSASKPEKLVERRGQTTGVLPEPPGARPAVSFAVGESGARAYYQTVNDATVAEVLAFYRQALPRAGWRVDEAVDAGGSGRVDASRARQSASVTVQQRAGREVSLSITVMGQT